MGTFDVRSSSVPTLSGSRAGGTTEEIGDYSTTKAGRSLGDRANFDRSNHETTLSADGKDRARKWVAIPVHAISAGTSGPTQSRGLAPPKPG